MKRANPWNDRVDVEISSDESSPSDADMKINVNPGINLPANNITVDAPAVDKISEADVMIRKAKLYQDYMKQISISTRRGSIIPFSTWMGLASSIKQLYGQPLHYLTNIHLKQWDQSRLGAENEYRPLDSIIDPRKAEANIWLMEEVHRQTTSHHYLAKLWLSDPMHEAFIDSIFPLL